MSLDQYQIIILKIGTASLTRDADRGINFKVINQLAGAAVELREQGHKVIIVSSGAMGLGAVKLGTTVDAQQEISYKQALTSVGQVDLINAYENVFKHYNVHVGQMLITRFGLEDEHRRQIIKSSIEKLFEIDVVPIINANDTVSTFEIEAGDNDSLGARVAMLIQAQHLVIVSDVNGLYDKDPNKHDQASLIREVREITDDIKALAGTGTGFGGMKAKVEAAEMCMNNGIDMCILGIEEIANIPAIVSGQQDDCQGTKFKK